MDNSNNIDVPFSNGLDTKSDPRVVGAPALRVCRNVQFTESGGIQKRRPRTAMPLDIRGGGSLGGDNPIRRIMSYGNEILAFTDKALYSYSTAYSSWYKTADYDAVKVEEESVLIDPNSQKNAECITMGGVTVFSWSEPTGQIYPNDSIARYAAVDAETGAVLIQPTTIEFDFVFGGSTGIGHRSPKLVAGTNKIILMTWDGVDQEMMSMTFDPSAPDLAPSALSVVWANNNGSFDVISDNGVAVFTIAGATGGSIASQYAVGTIDDNNTVTLQVKPRPSGEDCTIAARADGPGYVVVHEAFDLGGTMLVDKLDGSLADEVTGLDLDASNNLGDAGKVVAWTDADGTIHVMVDEDSTIWRGIVNPDNTVVPLGEWLQSASLASKPFIYCDEAYYWVIFDEPSTTKEGAIDLSSIKTQSTMFLFKEGLVSLPPETRLPRLVTSALKDSAAVSDTAPSVQDMGDGVFAFCALEKRQIITDGGFDGAEEGLRTVKVTFDSNDARRGIALGKTLYIVGGQILQYDGVGLTEASFHVYPWGIRALPGAGAGTLEEGTYSWLLSYRWDNAKGETDRSTTASVATLELDGTTPASLRLYYSPVTLKHPWSEGNSRSYAKLEVYRTVKNAGLSSPFYLVDTIDNNLLATNSFITIEDDTPDSSLINNEQYSEPAGVLGKIAPPAATIIETHEDRIYLAGIANFPNTVWYSRQKTSDEVASFNDGLKIEVPVDGGIITALKVVNSTLIVFCESAIYAFPGQGFSNTGQGNNYGPVQIISSDVGATGPDTAAHIPNGVVFLSRKGWHTLDRGWSIQYIGKPVEEFNGDDFTGVLVLEREHEIRCISPERVLVYDFNAGQWSEWTHENPVHSAILHKGTYYLAGDDGIYIEDAEHGNPTNYSMQIETSWLRLKGLSHYQRVKHVILLGEWRSDHGLLIELARDYDDKCYYQAKEFIQCAASEGDPLQVRHGPRIQKVQALKIRITDILPGSGDVESPPVGESLKLTGLTLDIGIKGGLGKLGKSRKQ